MSLHCIWGGVWEGAMALAPLSASFQSLPPLPTIKSNRPLWCWFPSGGACVHSRPLWVSPMNSPVRLGVSPVAASTPTGVFNQWLRLYFPTLEIWVVRSVTPSTSCCLAASCSFAHPTPQSTTLLGPLATALPWVLSAQLCVSVPPTSLDECFFFISLVVRLLCSSIFCQFWVCFVFKLLLFFFWLCEEAQFVYLRLHLGQNSATFLYIFNQFNLVPWPSFSFLPFPCPSSRLCKTLQTFFHRSWRRFLQTLMIISNHSPLASTELSISILCVPFRSKDSGITYLTGIFSGCGYHAFLKPDYLSRVLSGNRAWLLDFQEAHKPKLTLLLPILSSPQLPGWREKKGKTGLKKLFKTSILQHLYRRESKNYPNIHQ